MKIIVDKEGKEAILKIFANMFRHNGLGFLNDANRLLEIIQDFDLFMYNVDSSDVGDLEE